MDQTIFHLINERWTNPALDLFMAAISNVDIWKPLLIVIVLIAVILGGFKARACLLCMLLSLLVAQQFTSLLKSAFDRRRPKQVETVRMVELQRTRPEFLTLFTKPKIRFSNRTDRNNSGPSFPSGHTTNNTVIAVCLMLFYRWRGSLYWVVAVAVGYSRVYLGAHWPSDVLGTMFLAIGETFLAVALLELLWRWLGPRFTPTIHERHPGLIVDLAA